MGMSVKNRRYFVPVKRFFEAAGTQEWLDFNRFPDNGFLAG